MIISGKSFDQLKNIAFLIIILIIFGMFSTKIYALPIYELKNQINTLQEQLDQLNASKKSLQNSVKSAQIKQANAFSEIDKLNNRIDESKRDIEILEVEIKKSETEIDLTNERIQKAQSDIKKLDREIESLLIEQKNRINNIYQNTRVKSSTENIEVAIPTKVDKYISKTNYQKQLKTKGDEIFTSLTEKKSQKELEQTNIETQKLEQEKLLFALTDQKQSLENLKVELDKAISEQKHYALILGESIYENKVKAIEIEEQTADLDDKVSQLQNELFNNTSSIPGNGVHVKAGDFIGYMGDTGYSTGPHLHYFVSKNGSNLLDPCNYLSKGVSSACNYGNGELKWPMSEVRWSRGFSSSHGGIDTYAYTDLEVYASHDGYLIRGKEPCYSWFPICKDGGANYVIICETKNCSSGFKTGYWHLQ